MVIYLTAYNDHVAWQGLNNGLFNCGLSVCVLKYHNILLPVEYVIHKILRQKKSTYYCNFRYIYLGLRVTNIP